jgi:hypothetical protein
MKLYLLSTKGLGDYYVIAQSTDAAETELIRLLNLAEYGFSGNREVNNIKLISKELTYFPKDKPNFTNRGGELIIVKSQ